MCDTLGIELISILTSLCLCHCPYWNIDPIFSPKSVVFSSYETSPQSSFFTEKRLFESQEDWWIPPQLEFWDSSHADMSFATRWGARTERLQGAESSRVQPWFKPGFLRALNTVLEGDGDDVTVDSTLTRLWTPQKNHQVQTLMEWQLVWLDAHLSLIKENNMTCLHFWVCAGKMVYLLHGLIETPQVHWALLKASAVMCLWLLHSHALCLVQCSVHN